MRTVGTRLRAEVGQYVGPVKQAKRETKSLVDELQDAARSGDLTARAIGGIGPAGARSLPIAEKAAARLEDQIAETAREVQRLDKAFRETGDLTLFEDLEKQLRKLKGQLKARDLFVPDDVDREATRSGQRFGRRFGGAAAGGLAKMSGPISDAFGNALGVLPKEAQAAIGASLLVAVSTAAPVMGAAVSGAVVAGVSSGAVVAGLAAAFQDPRVRRAAEPLMRDLQRLVSGIGDDFVPAAIDALARLRRELQTLGLREALAPAAEYVPILVDGLVGLVRGVMPGLRALIAEGEAPMRALAGGLEELGAAVGDLLSMMAEHADEGAAALSMLFDIVVAGVKIVEANLRTLATGFAWLDSLPTWATGSLGVWIDRAKASSRATGEWRTELDVIREEIVGTTRDIEGLKSAFDELFGVQMSMDEATLNWQQGLIDLREELGEGNRTLDASTQAGIDNRQAILDQVKAAEQMYQATLDQTQSVDMASQAYAEHIGQLRATMRQMGYTEAEIDDLIGKYDMIPRNIRTNISVNVLGLNVARAAIAGLSAMGGVPRRWGGISEHTPARDGLLRDAQIASPVSPARYSWAEPATGGEAFIPKFGDRDRSLSILDRAAGWYGASVVPGRAGMGVVGVAAPATVRVIWDGPAGHIGDVGAALARWLRVEVDQVGGGSVQAAFGQG